MKWKSLIGNAIDLCKKDLINESLVNRFETLIFYNIDNKFDFREKLKKTVEEQEK